MPSKNPTTSLTGIVRRLTVKKESNGTNQTGSSPPKDDLVLRQHSESAPRPSGTERRSKTMSGLGSFKKPRLSFRSSSPDLQREESSPVPPPRSKKKQRSGSQFYDHEDITRRIIEPKDFPELNLRDKDVRELLLLLRPVSY